MRVVYLCLVLSMVLGPVAAAWGAQYAAMGDTGWTYASKRECCDAAIYIAQENSIQACFDTGGVPASRASRRGLCEWQWMADQGGGMLYRCTAEASVRCR